MQLIGREKEVRELNNIFYSGHSELVAVYGRRRVGKTTLIDETFKNRLTFSHTALPLTQNGKKTSLKEQLNAFRLSLMLHGYAVKTNFKTWLDAFYSLIDYIKGMDHDERIVIFIDEMPWMDTPRSGFVAAFSWFWNNWASKDNNIMVIVCGSSNAWILDEMINSHTGLYDRVTHAIGLSPLSLGGVQALLKERNIQLTPYNLSQIYMILGGVPMYLNYYNRELPLSKNIDALFFDDKAKLANEYDNLFDSTFDNGRLCRRINEFLATKNKGFTRDEIVHHLGICDGGEITKALRALEASDFIVKYYPFGEKKKQHYKLVDPFCLFYLKFVAMHHGEKGFWENSTNSASVNAWRGYAFENICFTHVEQIKNALQIGAIQNTVFSWAEKGSDHGAQIDLVIDRKDGVINLCEVKFTNDVFCIDKAYYEKLINKQKLFASVVQNKRVIHQILITTYGLKNNLYSDIFTNVVTLEDLLK